jgi:protein-arginine kinase activator protein McsA
MRTGLCLNLVSRNLSFLSVAKLKELRDKALRLEEYEVAALCRDELNRRSYIVASSIDQD